MPRKGHPVLQPRAATKADSWVDHPRARAFYAGAAAVVFVPVGVGKNVLWKPGYSIGAGRPGGLLVGTIAAC